MMVAHVMISILVISATMYLVFRFAYDNGYSHGFQDGRFESRCREVNMRLSSLRRKTEEEPRDGVAARESDSGSEAEAPQQGSCR